MPYRNQALALRTRIRLLKNERARIDAELAEAERRGPRPNYRRRAALLGVLLLGATVLFTCAAEVNRCCIFKVDRAATDVATLKLATVSHMLSGGRDCPSVSRLVETGELDAHSAVEDPWERPFIITCIGDHVQVTSVGADGMHNTEDDISTRPVIEPPACDTTEP